MSHDRVGFFLFLFSFPCTSLSLSHDGGLPSPAAASLYLGKGEKKQHRGEQERGFRAGLLAHHACPFLSKK